MGVGGGGEGRVQTGVRSKALGPDGLHGEFQVSTRLVRGEEGTHAGAQGWDPRSQPPCALLGRGGVGPRDRACCP